MAVADDPDPARPMAVISPSGRRSAIAASLLRRSGAHEVVHVADGGVGTWHEQGVPSEESWTEPVGR